MYAWVGACVCMGGCIDAGMEAWMHGATDRKDGHQAAKSQIPHASSGSISVSPNTKQYQHLHVYLAVLELGHTWGMLSLRDHQ